MRYGIICKTRILVMEELCKYYTSITYRIFFNQAYGKITCEKNVYRSRSDGYYDEPYHHSEGNILIYGYN